MNKENPSLQELADFLKRELAVENYPATEQGGIYYPSNREIRRLGLALEPFPAMADWINEQHIDALWLHRPWQLNLDTLPADVGVIAHHLPFDERLTVGYNQELAQQLGYTGALASIGYKQSVSDTGEPLPKRPIGMLIDVAEGEFDSWLATIKHLFDGYDRAEAGNGQGGWQPDSSRVAVVGAMTDALIREAAERNVQMYLTGDYRKPAQAAVDATGIAVIAVGHRRCEIFGLHMLADLIHKHWSVECLIYK